MFDLDDTLVDSTAAIDRWFVELAEERELGPGGLEFLRAEQKRPVPPEESLRAMIEHFGFPESPAQLHKTFARRLSYLARPFDGVLDNLRLMRERGWRTALLTNGMETEQRPKMRDGLIDLFDVVCYAYDEAVSKPDPEIFRRVAQYAGRDLEGAWMVGDSLRHDIAGAQAAGMATIWISGGRALPADGSVPDEVVKTAAEAFHVLLAL
ncbi:HAD family hydrolase [Streptomyces sp. NPDC001966]